MIILTRIQLTALRARSLDHFIILSLIVFFQPDVMRIKYFASRHGGKSETRKNIYRCCCYKCQTSEQQENHKSFYQFFFARFCCCRRISLLRLNFSDDKARLNMTLRQFKLWNSYVTKTCSNFPKLYLFIFPHLWFQIFPLVSFFATNSCRGNKTFLAPPNNSGIDGRKKSLSLCDLKSQEELHIRASFGTKQKLFLRIRKIYNKLDKYVQSEFSFQWLQLRLRASNLH